MAIFLIAFFTLSAVFYGNVKAYTYTWSTNTPLATWTAVASDSTGQYLAATRSGNYIYTSNDNGTNWVQQTAGLLTHTWTGIDSSNDGSILYASPNPGYIYSSSDYGATWITQTGSGSRNWVGISTSITGEYVAGITASGDIYVSDDYGVTWTGAGLSNTWTGITVSGTGQYMVATGSASYESHDYGVTWGSISGGYGAVAYSTNGEYLYASTGSGIDYSIDHGATFSTLTVPGGYTWLALSTSGDGDVLVAGSATDLYSSPDFGLTWTLESGAGSSTWVSVANSSNGQQIIAGASPSVWVGEIPTTTTITNVTVDPGITPDGTYGVGAAIQVEVTFSDVVTVTGTPILNIATGVPSVTSLNYNSGSGSNKLIFDYVVAAGNTSVDLAYTGRHSLLLNGGNIIDSSLNQVSLVTITPGSPGSLNANRDIVIDTSATPYITDVTSGQPNATYTIGNLINISVTFDQAVDVTGTPVLELANGALVNYVSGSGSDTLSFDYVVGSSDGSTLDLDYDSTGALTIIGATIKSLLAVDANLTLPSPGASGSLGFNKDIAINVPVDITNVTSSTANGTYTTSDSVSIQVAFSDIVNVTGTPQIDLATGSPVSTLINYVSGTGTNTLTFTYTVASGNHSLDLAYNSGSINLNGGTINSVVGFPADLTLPAPGGTGSLDANKAIVIDAVAPTVTNVTSSKPNGTYTTGENITVSVTFDKVVTVTGAGTLTLNIVVALPAVSTPVSYSSGSGTNTLNFVYTVFSGNNNADLDYDTTGGLYFVGLGTVEDSLGNEADLTLPGVGGAGSLAGNKAIVIDTTAPVIAEVTPVSTPGTDTTPNYTFSSTEAGTISYLGGCTSSTTSASAGSNTITFDTLAVGTYSGCQIIVTDVVSITSNTLSVSSFTINATTSGGGGGCSANCGRQEAPKCTNPTAINYMGNLPCVFPVPTCTDISAINYGSTNACEYRQILCENLSAINYGGSLPCRFATTCNDVLAINYGQTGTCEYRTICEDRNATNYGGALPCSYAEEVEETCTGVSCDTDTGTGDGDGAGDNGTGGGDEGTVSTGGGSVFDCSIQETGDSVLDKVIHGARLSYCQTVESVFVTKDKVREILNSKSVDNISKTVATAGVVGGAAVAITTTLFLNPISFSELFLIPVRLWSLLMTTLGLKKRRRPWGTVYDSVTKQPLDPAYVTLRTVDGKEITSSLTDLDGRYGFIVPAPGVYALVATKTNYKFPSQKLVGYDHDELYRDLYFGEYINVITPGEIIIRNIPMDPEKFDWNEFAKKDQNLMKFYKSKNKLLFRIADIFFGFGFTVSTIATLTAPKVYNVVIFALYVGVFLLKKYGISARPFGGIVEKATGNPISFGIIRISSVSTSVEIMHRITDATGKYYCLLPNGQYFVRIDKKLPDGTYQILGEKIPVMVTKGYLAETFEL